MPIKIKINFDINYLFAFLHGAIHPIILISYAPNKIHFSLLIFSVGLMTLFQYWLLHVKLKIPFEFAKGILAFSTSSITFFYLLGFSIKVLGVSFITALILSFFSYIMLEKVITEEKWGKLFPVLVLGQLFIFFIGFILSKTLVQ